jgi:hypothetical protein
LYVKNFVLILEIMVYVFWCFVSVSGSVEMRISNNLQPLLVDV